MREILFRGKRTDNGEWITDSETYIRDGDGIWLSDENLNVVTVIPETVGQFTGLTDKNGVRIFEGDIVSLVKYGNLTFTVVYDHCRYELFKANETSCFVLSIYKSEDIEVIGNIHDNPELLGSASQSDSADIAQDVLKPATPQNLSLCRDKNLDTT